MTAGMAATGITCPACCSQETLVTDSRPSAGFLRRRRKCEQCERAGIRLRFSTIEIVVPGSEKRLSDAGVLSNAEPVFRAMKLRRAIDDLPPGRRLIIDTLLKEFGIAEDET